MSVTLNSVSANRLMKSNLTGKVVLVTGGTGSFGNSLIKRLINEDINEIRILSRDEKKQHDMRLDFNTNKLKFIVGDVRDEKSVRFAVDGCSHIFHAAALKQVPSCEFYPMEAIKTNVIGTQNVLDEAIRSGVERVVVLSTDKAVQPINAMGISKAMMEKIALSVSRDSKNTIINITRYGNVLCSRGSVVPLFVEQIISGKPVTVTDPRMTRFIMTLEDAVELVMHAFAKGKNGETFVQKSPSTTIETLLWAICRILKVSKPDIDIIGTRHGEKHFETLLTESEVCNAEICDKFFCVKADNRGLNYKAYYEEGSVRNRELREYNSNNTRILDIEETILILKRTGFFSKYL